MSQPSMYIAALCFQIITIGTGSWSSPNSTLPLSTLMFAVGEHNGTIFLIGGDTNQSRTTVIELSSDYTRRLRSWNLSFPIYGAGQFWHQKQEKVYMIISNKLSAFNMETKQHIASSLIPRDVSWHGCLAGTGEYIFVVGGSVEESQGTTESIASLQVHYLPTNKWLTNASSMNFGRAAASCIVHQDYLYAISGSAESWLFGPLYDTYERIDITDVTSNSWGVSNLQFPAMGSRAVNLADFIYVIGGYTGTMVTDDVQIIDPNTGTVSVADDTLSFAVAFNGIINVNDVIYSFMGLSGGAVNRWMYKQFTSNPTSDPTKHPSIGPTVKYGEASVEIITTTLSSTKPVEDIEGQQSNEDEIVIPLLLSLAVVLLLVVAVYLYFRKRTKSQKQSELNIESEIKMAQEQPADPGAETCKKDEAAEEEVEGEEGNDKGNTLQMASHMEQHSVKKMNLKREGSYSQKKNIAEDEFIVDTDDVMKGNEMDPKINLKREGSHFADDVHGNVVANTRGKVLRPIHEEATKDTHITKGFKGNESNDEHKTNEVQLGDNEFIVEGDDEAFKGTSTSK